MDIIRKNKAGKVSHVLGVEAELVSGLLLLGVGALGVLWVYIEPVFNWISQYLE